MSIFFTIAKRTILTVLKLYCTLIVLSAYSGLDDVDVDDDGVDDEQVYLVGFCPTSSLHCYVGKPLCLSLRWSVIAELSRDKLGLVESGICLDKTND